MKKLVFLALTLAIALFAFAGCDGLPIPGIGGGTQGGGGNTQEPENLIYNLDSELAIVRGEGVDEDTATTFWEEIGVASGNYGRIVDDSAEAAKHEIVIGKSTRPVSVEAYRLLDRIQQNNKHDYRMLLYSDGSSIAFAYDVDEYGIAFSKVMEYLRANCVKSELTFAKGTVYSDHFDIIEALTELDVKERQAQWEEFEKQLATLAGEASAKAITEEFKSFYQLFNSGLVTWMANLFDPDICVCDSLYGLTECEGHELCGTAGFYFTSSGRDTKGFLPIVEAMKSIMAFVKDMGLTETSAVNYFPAEYVERMGQFVYHLQDPDGYFYHPQWGKEIGISRRGRDYGWCVSLLNRFGLKSKYPLLDSVPEAEETSSKTYLPTKFGASVATLASKVVAAESEILIPYYLVDIPAFEDYLENLWKNGSYSAGSQIATIRSQIQAREKTTGMPFGETLMNFLDSKQLDNGIWHEKTDYDGINGVMKIMGTYNSYKRPVKNINLTLQASIDCILSEEIPSAVTEVWNPWSALASCLSNLNTCYSAEEAKAYRQELYELIPEAIKKSKEYDSMFLKTDGSFSYYPGKATPTMMGYPCGVPNTNEGDMDGSILASTYMVSSINSVLGITSAYSVDVFGDAEGLMFMEIIESASPVRKAGGGEVLGEPTTFDEMEVGEKPSNISFNKDSITGLVVKEEDEARGNSYRVTTSKNWETMTIGCDNPGAKNASTYVFESDFCVESYVSGKEAIRIDLGTGGDNKAIYRILLISDDTGVNIWDTSSIDKANAIKNDLGLHASFNEWFKLRVECYVGDAKAIRFKIYFNGKLAAVTDNFYNRDGSKVTSSDVSPNSGYTGVMISTDSANDPAFRIDNVHAYNANDVYVYTDLEIPGGVNVDEKVQDEKVYSFDELADGESYSELTVSGDAAGVESDTDGGKYLSLPVLSSVSVPATLRSSDSNCISFSLDLAENGQYEGEVARIKFIEKNSPFNTMTGFVISSNIVDGVLTASVTELLSGNPVTGVSFPLDSFSNVRFDYYTMQGVVLIYLGEQKVGMSMSTNSTASRMTFGNVSVEAAGNLYVDNIKCEKINKSFEDATASKYPEVVHGKGDVGFDAITTTGDVKLTDVSGDSKLTVNKNSSVKVPVNLRDDATNVSVVEFSINVDASARAGKQYQLLLADADEQVILSFVLLLENGKMVIRESTAYGDHIMNIAEFDIGKEAKLTFEYFAVEGECNVYIDGECAFVTTMYYYVDTRYSVPASLEIKSYTNSAPATIDNVKCERVNKIYVPKNLSYKNPEDDAEELTFEYSTSTSLPNSISASFRDPGTYITLSEALNGDGEATKAMLFHSVKGNYDTIVFKPNKVANTVKSHVFQADICFSGDNFTGNYFEINFMSKSVSKAYRITFVFEESNVALYENDDRTPKYDIASKNEWFKLRVEYYVIGSGDNQELKVKVFVDDTLVYLGEDTYSSENAPAEDIHQVQFNATKNTVGSVMLDNISYTQSDEEYVPEK